MEKIKWYELKDTGDFEKADFSYPLPDGFLSSSFLTFQLEEARCFIIERLKIEPKLEVGREFGRMLRGSIVIVMKEKELFNIEKQKRFYEDSPKCTLVYQNPEGSCCVAKDSFYTLAQDTLESLCLVAIAKNTNKKGLLDAVYHFASTYEQFSIANDLRKKTSIAGEARSKKYKDTKQKVFEYAQDLLNKSKTKYTANALADKITNAYLLGNIPEIKFDTENPKPTIYRWLKNEFSLFQNNEKKI